mgnify:CR=1 FL=1
MEGNPNVLEVSDLRVFFDTEEGTVRAVDGVTFSVPRGRILALVGESGCGKSVTALSLARLLPETARYRQGEILLRGQDVLKMDAKALTSIRGQEIAYVFQEPSSALNPVFTTGAQIEETVKRHRPDEDAGKECLRLLNQVGLKDPETLRRRYPHELSGGMQQRVMIAMALSGRPSLLVADEPTSALDVTTQAQIMGLLNQCRDQLGLSVLLIAHNLALVADFAKTVNILYAGQIVESGPTRTVLTHPRHPYTKGLLTAIPRMDRKAERLSGIEGTVPAADKIPSGCAFHPRCSYSQALCSSLLPGLESSAEGCSDWPSPWERFLAKWKRRE